MSLLMDALKKAEQEKKAAAKRQQEIERSGDNAADEEQAPERLNDTWEHEFVDGDTTAEIVDSQGVDSQGVDSLGVDPQGADPGAETTGPHSTTAELELEPISRADDTAEIPSVEDAAVEAVEPEDPTLNVTMNELALADLAAEGLDGDDADSPDAGHTAMEELQTEEAELLDESFHGVVVESMDLNAELFQETVQGEQFLPESNASVSYGETLPGIPAAQMAIDIGSDDQPTPVAAQTIFSATGTMRTWGMGFKWVFAGLGSLALIAGVVWYYVAVTPMNRMLPSPQIAAGIEQAGPPLNETLNLNIEPMTGTLSGSTGSAVTTGTAPGTTTIEPPAAQATEGSAPPSTGAQASPPAVVETEKSVAPPRENAGVGPALAAAKTAAGKEPLPDQKAATGLPESIVPEPSLIRITRSKPAQDRGQSIKAAYTDYLNGDYDAARAKYAAVLKEYPDNRDALLGLGSIAGNRGDYNAAYSWYARVLKINPGDEFAKTALINLQDRVSILNSESAIKSMLHDSPDQHYLYFTLGNIYAAGSRWAEAQQAFFDAYRLNSGNPDYALNLAVSLDHIGQYRSALDYYHAALELADSTPSTFDTSQVKTRIDDLNQVAER